MVDKRKKSQAKKEAKKTKFVENEPLEISREEQELEALLFGETPGLIESPILPPQPLEDPEPFGFVIDTKISGVSIDEAPETLKVAAWSESHESEEKVELTSSKKLLKLRSDFDETSVSLKEYESRLRNQYEKMHPTPNWAVIEEDAPKEPEDLISALRETHDIAKTRVVTLPSDHLDVFRLKDANVQAYSQCVIQSLSFHPRAPILFTAGFDKTLRFFQIDGKHNSKIQSVYFKDLPIHNAQYIADAKQVVVTGRRNFFYFYDLETGDATKIHSIRGRDERSWEYFKASPCGQFIAFMGRNGYILLVSSITKQLVGELKMNGTVTDIAFTADGSTLYSIGGDSEIYAWDVDSRSCLFRFPDHGCVKAGCIKVSGNSKWLATGSDSGVVNLYSLDNIRDSMGADRPVEPNSMILNLTTPITSLDFNHDSQLLAIASDKIKDAMRVFHIPSRSVMKNWPTGDTPLGYVSTIAFAPDSRYIAIGNAKGKTLLYQLISYK